MEPSALIKILKGAERRGTKRRSSKVDGRKVMKGDGSCSWEGRKLVSGCQETPFVFFFTYTRVQKNNGSVSLTFHGTGGKGCRI